MHPKLAGETAPPFVDDGDSPGPRSGDSSSPLAPPAGEGKLGSVTRAVRDKPADLPPSLPPGMQVDPLLGKFLGELAHAVGNAVFPFRIISDLIEHPNSDRSVLERLRSMLSDHTPTTVDLINHLRRAARVARDNPEPQPRAVELGALVLQAVEATRPRFAERRQPLELNLPQDPITFSADPELLSPAIAELLENASSYTPVEGRIAVEVQSQNGEAVVRVRDEGIGIAPELLPRVFDLFFRGEGTFDFAAGRFGVGSTFVRQVAHKHGGTVEAHSAGPGQGSEFLIRLPLTP
jgi:signal transduction histidine kinase